MLLAMEHATTRRVAIESTWALAALAALLIGMAPGAAWAAADPPMVAKLDPAETFKKMRPARGAPEPDARPAVIGEMTRYIARYEDTLVDLARRYNVGYTELRAANPQVDPWLPGAGTEILIPTVHLLPGGTREGLVVNLADQRLYYFPPDGGRIMSAPIGIGTGGWLTPTGRTRVVRKRARPTWYVPKSIRAEDPDLPAIVPPGPDNPLGEFALYLGWRAYIIHGTNKPFGVGRRVSHGCVRMYPEDIAWMFKEVKIGTPVTVVDEPVKVAWVGDELMLEVHPSQAQADQLEAGDELTPESPAEFRYRILDKAGQYAGRLDWQRITDAVRQRSGLPVSILKRKDAAG